MVYGVCSHAVPVCFDDSSGEISDNSVGYSASLFLEAKHFPEKQTLWFSCHYREAWQNFKFLVLWTHLCLDTGEKKKKEVVCLITYHREEVYDQCLAGCLLLGSSFP